MKIQEKKNSTQFTCYSIKPVNTNYIKPNESLNIIIETAGPLIEDGDYLIISETPVSVSQGRLVDESQFKASISAIILADVWSKYIWGYLLGPLFRIKKRTINNLRKLPPESRAHKEVVLQYYGLKHALKPASEAGIDLSNVPGTMVSLLPNEPNKVAVNLSRQIQEVFGKNVTVLIIDTDVTYQLAGKKFTCLPIAIDGIKSNTGIFGYILGRLGKIAGPTPLGTSSKISVEKAIEIANIAEDYQKSLEDHLSTVYHMKNKFGKDGSHITIDMLNSITHTPAIVVKESENNTILKNVSE
jgi:F420-0:gamma-glutamyl ligase-like protein